MNETTPPTDSVPEGERPPDAGAGRPRKLARSRSDRYIGGVAAGIAGYLRIDPILVRLAFVASIIFGGIGVVAYLVLLALLPIEGDPDQPLEPIEGKKRNWVIAGTVAVGLLALLTFGNSGWIFGFGPGTVFGIFAWLIAIGLVAWLVKVSRDGVPVTGAPAGHTPVRQPDSPPGATPAGSGPAETPTSSKSGSVPTGSKPGSVPTGSKPGSAVGPAAAAVASTMAASPSQTAPVAGGDPGEAPTASLREDPSEGDSGDPTAVMPERPVDNGPSTIGKIMTWFAIGISGLIVLSILAIGSFWITAVLGAIPMASLIILLGGGMIFAAIRGRQGIAAWMLAVALTLALPMAVVSIADLRIEGSYGEVKETPTIAGDLPEDGYQLAGGQMTVDMRGYPFTAGEAVDLEVHSGLGVTNVIVPDRVCVIGDFSGKAGLADVRGTESSGVDVKRQIGDPGNGAPTLNLDAEFKLGVIEVADTTEWRANRGDPGNFGTFNYNDNRNRQVRERALAACEGEAAGSPSGSGAGSAKAGNEKGGGRAAANRSGAGGGTG